MWSNYLIQWTEWNKKGEKIYKTKSFTTENAMMRFAEKIETKDNFQEIIAYSYPQ